MENCIRCSKRFFDHGGAQCGICTPGMLMAATQLLEHNPHPSNAPKFAKGSPGNLCRCTGFMRIFESVAAAATRKRKSGNQANSEQTHHAR